MSAPNTHYVYQEPAIEFVTVAVQLCLYLEQAAEHEKADFIEKMLCLLPLLYLKARLLPKATEEMDGYPERFVTEQEYEDLRQFIAQKLGSDDAYLEVFVEEMRYSDEPITAFISENIADIYQEIKDLLGVQVYSSVKMQQTIEKMIADGVDTFVEIGPGKTIAGFIKKVDRSVNIINIEKVEDLEKLKEIQTA